MRKNDKKQKIEKLMAVERERESNTLVDVKHNTSSSNSYTENSKKLRSKNILLVLLVLIVIAIISMYAYAKYQSSMQGNTNSQIAKWSFKIKDGDTSTIDVLDFPITRTDENNKVDRSTIAPRNIWQISNRYRCNRNRDKFNI